MVSIPDKSLEDLEYDEVKKGTPTEKELGEISERSHIT